MASSNRVLLVYMHVYLYVDDIWGGWGLRSSTEYLVETGVAIGFILLLLERALVQLLQTEGAYEMFRMEFLEHGRNTTSRYRFRTARTEGSTLGMIMRLTIGQTLVIKERTTLERLSTVLKIKKSWINFENF